MHYLELIQNKIYQIRGERVMLDKDLAELYELMKEYDRALPLFESALEMTKLEYGDQHPMTGMRLNQLAELYESREQHDRALPLFESALEISRSGLSDLHNAASMSLYNLEK